MKKIIMLFVISCRLGSYAQDVKNLEQDLLQHLKKINSWSAYSGKSEKINAMDSLVKENEIFNNKLLDYTSKQSITLTYDFSLLQKESLNIASSADKKFRIYSWDTKTGGTMHIFKNVYQYRSGNNVFSKSIKAAEGNPGGWISEIFDVAAGDKNFYLGYFNAIYSSKDVYQAVKCFEIITNNLNEVKLIKTKSGLTNQLGFGFDFFSVSERKERPVKLIYYDSIKRIIKIPVVTGKGKVTDKFIVFKFTGSYFAKQQ